MAEYSSNDPFRPLLSLADQKTLDLATKLTEKKIAQGPSEQLLPDGGRQAAIDRLRRGGAEGAGLLDIAKSSIYQGNTRLFDAIHGRSTDPEELQRIADQVYGITPDDRAQLVGNQQQEVIESLAQGNYLDAIVGGVKAAPGTLADSANVLPDIAAGVVATAVTGGAAAPLVFGKKAKSVKGAFDKAGKAIDSAKQHRTRLQMVKEAAKTLPKTAGQMSVVTADITQAQIAEYEQNYGERPSAERIAQMYAINLVTMTAEGGIIKSLFIPKFKEEFSREALSAVRNIRGGSNLGRFGERLGEAFIKVSKAAGAEAAQEYVQTWADIVNTGIRENEDFIAGVQRELGKADNQLQAMAGAALGLGAGGLARGVIAAPAVAAGSAVDTVKGTTKTAVKGASTLIRKASSTAGYAVLSEEERAQIAKRQEAREEILSRKIAEGESRITAIQKAKTVEDLKQDPIISDIISSYQQEKELTDTAINNPKNFKKVQDALVRRQKGAIKLLTEATRATYAGDIATRTAAGVGTKTVAAAAAAMEAVAPNWEQVVETVKDKAVDMKDSTVKAIKEIRSSTALGMIELAANAGAKESAQILKAAQSLSLDDLNRATAVISEINPDIAKKMQGIKLKKEKALKAAGSLTPDIVNAETLSDAIKEIPDTVDSMEPGQAVGLSLAIDEALAGNITDIEAVTALEKALDLVEKSPEFKNQSRGIMSRDGMVVARTKLKKRRERIERDLADEAKTAGVKAAEAVKRGATAAAEKVKETLGPTAEKVEKAIKERAQTKSQEKLAETITPRFAEKITRTAEIIQDPEAKPEIMKQDTIDALVAEMKENGIENRADYEVFLDMFPEIASDAELLAAIEQDPAYQTNIVADEVVDWMGSKIVKFGEESKKAFLTLFPGCAVS